MIKLRLALSKGEELRFLSHLDYAQAVERMIRRAGIAMAYSEGFNPHMKISFSSALALGVTASAEYMDMDVTEDCSPRSVMERLNKVAPAGLEVLAVKEMPQKVKKMMAVCNYAIYEVTGPVTSDVNWDDVLEAFNSAESIEFEKVTPKKTRIVDVRTFLKDPVRAELMGDHVKLTMGIGIYPEGTVKPGEVWKLGRERFGWPVTDRYEIHRRDLLIQRDGQFVTPMDVSE